MTESMDRAERVLVKYPLFKTAVARIQECFDSHDATAEPDCCPLSAKAAAGRPPSFRTSPACIHALITSGVLRYQCWLRKYLHGQL